MRALFQVPFAGLVVIITYVKSSNKLRLMKRLIKYININIHIYKYIYNYNDGCLSIYTIIIINLDNKLLANLNLYN